MWQLINPNSTNTITVTQEGIVSVTKPDSITVYPYVNDVVNAVHHVHVKLGDQVYFKLQNSETTPVEVTFDYAGASSTILVPGKPASAEETHSTGTYSANTKEDIMTPAETINLFANPNQGNNMGGAIGGGLGAGLLGGVLGGALLGNNGVLGNNRGNYDNGNFTHEGVVTPALLASTLASAQDNTRDVVAASERLNMARFDADSQREIQAAVERTAAATQLAVATGNAALGVEIARGDAALGTLVAKGQGEITTQVALGTGTLNTQNALNAAAIQTLVQKTSGELATQVALNTAAVATAVERTGTATAIAFKDQAIQGLQSQYALATAIKADGDLTRGLIIAQNDASLNRQLSTAQAEIIELRHDGRYRERARETEVNVTQSVTQNQNNLQAQQQQQQQFQILANLAAQVGNLANDIQVVRQTQSNVNFGTQTGSNQTASAANNRVN